MLKNTPQILGTARAPRLAEDDTAHAINPDCGVNYFHATVRCGAAVGAWPLR